MVGQLIGHALQYLSQPIDDFVFYVVDGMVKARC